MIGRRKMSWIFLEKWSRADTIPSITPNTASGGTKGIPRLALGAGIALMSVLASMCPFGARLMAQEQRQVIDLTLDRMVDLTLSTSYQIRRLNLEIQRDQHNLHAEQARLKPRQEIVGPWRQRA